MSECTFIHHMSTTTAAIDMEEQTLRSALPLRMVSYDLLRAMGHAIPCSLNAIRGYNHFVQFGLARMIEQQSVLPTEFQTTYVVSNVRAESPMTPDGEIILPQYCRVNGITYSCNVYVDITKISTATNKPVATYHRVLLFELPCMVRSILCNLHTPQTKTPLNATYEDQYDVGGYFIINGNARVLVMQEYAAYNNMLAFHNETKQMTTCSMRSMSTDTGHSVYIELALTSNELCISLPFLKKNAMVPLRYVLVLLGMKGTTEFREYIINKYGDSATSILWVIDLLLYDEELTYEECLQNVTKEIMPTKHISSDTTREDFVLHCLYHDMFPHLTLAATPIRVVWQLLMMVERVAMVHMKLLPPSDRDHVQGKRYYDSGELIYYLVSSLYKRLIIFLKKRIQDNVDIRTEIEKYKTMTKNLTTCFAKGNWGLSGGFTRSGVCQLAHTVSASGLYSYLNRVMFPVQKDSKNKNVDIRRIHCSQYGYIDPVDTPEGQMVGITKYLSLFVRVSLHMSIVSVKNYVHDVLGETVRWTGNENGLYWPWSIALNGEYLGSVENPDIAYSELVKARDMLRIPEEVSIMFDPVVKCIRLQSDVGRLLRPLLVVRLLPLATQCKSVEDLIRCRVLQWIDAQESTSVVIAPSLSALASYDDATYCEVHSSMILGTLSSLIPFLEHNQGPRNTYECSMVKQSIGVPCTNFRTRGDTHLYLMNYTQSPLIHTVMDKALGTAELGYGMNAIVAICTFTGYNQEDSLIMNKSAVDRGLYVVSHYKTVSITESNRDKSSDFICLVEDKLRNPVYDYSLLDEDGIIRVGVHVKANHVLVGKLTTCDGNPIDTSVVITHKEVSNHDDIYVDNVMVSQHLLHRTVQVVLRMTKRPEIGDKWSSRIAQKGVCGMMYTQEDMPFTSSGIVPDIIINALCIPSRMTIGQLMECVLGKAVLMEGADVEMEGDEEDAWIPIQDCTAFTHKGQSVVDLAGSLLKKHGYMANGEEVLYSGTTGERMQGTVFMGPTYYQRLKQLVSDKYHARSHGDIQGLTRQPVEGRSRDGGLRVGEMETEAMEAYGMPVFLRERMMNASDAFDMFVCDYCKRITYSQNGCPMCQQGVSHRTRVPYVFKLFLQELQAMGVEVELETSDE